MFKDHKILFEASMQCPPPIFSVKYTLSALHLGMGSGQFGYSLGTIQIVYFHWPLSASLKI